MVFTSTSGLNRAGTQYTTLNGNLTASLPSTVSSVQSVTIGGNTYNLAYARGLNEPGTFDFYDGTLTVYPLDGTLPDGNLTYFSDAIATEYKSNWVNENEPFLNNYNFIADVTINRALSGHPSASFTIATTREEEANIRQALRQGTEINLLGIGFFVASFNRERYSPTRYGDYLVFNVNLVGKWSPKRNTKRGRLDEPFKLSNTNNILLSEIFNRINVPFSGEDLTVFLPKNNTNIVVARQQLENNVISTSSYVYYSNPNQVETRLWDKGIAGIISLDDVDVDRITPEDGENYGHLYGDVPLAVEFRNALLSFDSVQDATGTVVTFEYEKANNEAELITAPVEVEGFKANLDGFRTANNAFDSGGLVKVEREVTVENSTTISIKERKFGYVYLTKDMYEKLGVVTKQFQLTSPLLLQAFWKEIELTTTYRFFDDDGWHLGDRTTGYKLVRYRKESGTETVDLGIELQEETDPVEQNRLQAIIDTYDWFQQPVNRTSINSLDDLTNFYSDVTADDSGVIPKYNRRITTLEDSVSTIPDPATSDLPLDDPERQPDLMTGTKYLSTKDIVIVTPSSIDATIRQPEKYVESSRTQNAEGEGKNQAAELGSRREITSRPGTVERKVNYDSLSVLVPEINYQSSTKYFVNSEGSDVNDDIERETLSYPNVFDINKALEIARVDLSFKNREAQIISVPLKQRTSFGEGDFVLFDGNVWVILSITESMRISRANGVGQLLLNNHTLRLGRVLFPEIALTTA